MLPDTFCLQNFFTHDTIQKTYDYLFDLGAGEPYHDHSRYQGRQTLEQLQFDVDQHGWIQDHVVAPILVYFGPRYRVVDAYRQILYLPFDVHTDWESNSGPNSFNLLIPLQDNGPTRTIVFNQRANYKHFYLYKQLHSQVPEPIEQNFWNQNLAHCWPEDRLYLTVHTVMPWQELGQLQVFRRELFHSSDCYHLRGISEKRFLQLYINEIPD